MISLNRTQELFAKLNTQEEILVLGDVGLDKYTLGRVSRISPEAPVPVVEVYKEWEKMGLAANVAENIKVLGGKALLCGIVGEDKAADALESLLEEFELSTWGLVAVEKRMTIFKERIVAENQQICRVDYESSEPISLEDQEKFLSRVSGFLPGKSSVIIEDYGKGLFNLALLQKLYALFSQNNIKTFVDPSRHAHPQIYQGSFLFKPNRIESEILVAKLGYHTRDISEMAHILINALELENIVITLGKDGMAIKNKNDSQLTMIPTFAKEVYDVSGAGDTAISTITLMMSAGATLEEAAWIANYASGVVVGKRGTSNVNQKEIFDFIKLHNL